MYGAITLVGGVVSSMLGGLMGDKLSEKTKMGNSWVLIAGCALGLPCFVASVLLKNNFWACCAFIGLKTLLGENWFAPSLTLV